MLSTRLLLVRPEMTRAVLGAASNATLLRSPSIQDKKDIIGVKALSTAITYAKLPKLPVPDANRTLAHFLEFAKPLQTQKEYEITKQAVEQFKQNELPKLQKLLEERAQKMNNWLTPWWLNIAYLAARTPLPVVTSPAVMFPRFDYDGEKGQIEHAAKITQAAMFFYQKVQKNQVPQDMAGKVPFDMSQYRFLFGTTRIPRDPVDEIKYGCDNQNQIRHIAVIRNGHVFTVPVLDKNNQILSLSAIKSSLDEVVAKSQDKQAHSVGIVSSDKRDKWAAMYTSLESHPVNSANLRAIEDALFVVCLDQPSEPLRGYSEKDEQSRQSLHGGGSKYNSCNRWFDKTIQFNIGTNGFCGMTYEHTPAEGPPVAALMDFVCDQFDSNSFIESGAASNESIKRLDFELDDQHKQRIALSTKKMDKVVDDLDMVAYTYKRYGKNFPKMAKISPDSFIQMAFQLAFYRIHSSVPPTYETATLRKFEEGRTENIRSPNTHAEAFVKKMSTGRSSIPDLYEALKMAAETHKKYTVDCMNGAGMDRHLLAWNLLALENALPKPSILTTPVYQHLTHFQVSTSQVPTRHFIQMSFGPSAPDCYGICYNPQEKELHFTVSSFRSYGSTSSKRFVKELEKALNDMYSVCSKALKEQSKL